MNAHQLRHQSQVMAQRAEDMRKLADMIEVMPNPISHFVLYIAQALQRYALCVVDKAALMSAMALIEGIDIDACEEPRETSDRITTVLAALKQALHPPMDLEPLPEAPVPTLTPEEVGAIAASMPGGMAGFAKGWGWEQFAAAVLEAAHRRARA